MGQRLRRAAKVLFFCALVLVVVPVVVFGEGESYSVPEADASKTYLKFDSMQAETGIGTLEHCSNYEFCKEVIIYDSDSCPDQVAIDFNWFDENEQWVNGDVTVINSPDAAGAAFVEVGLTTTADQNVSAFEYFEVFEVSCTTDQLTGQATL